MDALLKKLGTPQTENGLFPKVIEKANNILIFLKDSYNEIIKFPQETKASAHIELEAKNSHAPINKPAPRHH